MTNRILISVLLLSSMAIIGSCKKEEPEDTGTCTDGIQNQGETRVDCGGPCTPCDPTLCNGNGSTDYFPLNFSNMWYYSGNDTFSINIDTMLYLVNFENYHEVNSVIYNSTEAYMRTENGNIFICIPPWYQEIVYIPATISDGKTWNYGIESFDKRTIKSINATVTTPYCTYTDCLWIEESGSSFAAKYNYYYKKGIGIVKKEVVLDGVVTAYSNLALIKLN